MSDLQCPATVLIARHGQAAYDTDLWTDDGGMLTDLGRQQAGELAEGLRSRRISQVYPSTLVRAVQTAEIIAQRLGVSLTPLSELREFDPGDGVGQPRDTDPFAPTFTRWLAGEHDAVMPGAESGTQVLRRMRDALQQISDLHRGETVLVVSHGGVMRFTLPVLDGYRCPVAEGSLPNCAVVEFDIDNDDWICRHWPD